MSSADAQVNRFGLTEVFRPATRWNVDIVFVHGLNGDPHATWTSEKSKVFWPAQLLPSVLEEEKTRILVYGYDADVTSFTDGVSRDKIHNHAEHLIAELSANRRVRKATNLPIIFVAHSLGGLVVKRALIYSSEIRGSKTEHLRSIFVSTYGILFLGTPHKGSNIAEWGSRLGRICDAVMPKKILDHSSQLVDALKSNNETLQNIDRQFIQIMSRFHIYFFHEGKPTDLKGTLRYVVDEDSASPTVQDVERAGIQADHSHMCKFDSDNAPGFDLVAEGIQRYADDAPDTILGRWEAEMGERRVRGMAEVAEVSKLYPHESPHNESTGTSPGNSSINLPLKSSTELPNPNTKGNSTDTNDPPSKPSEPYFIVPPGFRANTFFVGMEKELQELDRRLFDRRRRDGTACVLLHGQPGGGKSHLARQYVNKHRKKFSGGIFWIIAQLKEERYQAFWNIHQKVVAREAFEFCVSADGTERPFVESVKAWFEARQEWLIVFDGVVVDKDSDATELQSFVPDSKNSSIIYISRAKNLESKQRLLRPFPIKVSSLKEDDARKLLFKELHIKKPTEAEIRSATQLVKKVGGLPLAIDAICHRLADTHEPLAKYNMKSYSADPKMGGTYNKILDDLQSLGHMAAWNLIHILCFYGQHIPVEMVHLGLRSLRSYPVEVRSLQEGDKADINTTFGILMRYALIERNEPAENESFYSSRDSLVDPEPIDMLKIHSVVQKFCCDSLHARKLLVRWLGYAVRLFSSSFKEADTKIKQKTEPGRVSDYRYYLVHGKRLLDHSFAYENKAQPLDGIRRELEPVLAMIHKEIENHKPSSSQEITQGVFQVSIFDRTSSSSESGPSAHETPTPEHRPTPLPLPHENLYGMDFGKPMDSPGSFGTSSPVEPRIVTHVAGLLSPPYYQDDGYESDREGLDHSHSMQKNLSDTTARPRAPSPVNHGEGWQVVPPSRKPRKPRDLGSFRPTPARAQVNRLSAIGSVAQPVQESNEQPEGSVDAFTKLREVNHRSPPRSKNEGASFWQRRPSGLLPKQQHNQPTYAGVLAQTHKPPNKNVSHQETGHNSRPEFPLITDHIYAGPALDSPPYEDTNLMGNRRNSSLHQYTLHHSHSSPPNSLRPRYMNENIYPEYSRPLVQGPNPNSLLLDQEIMTTRRPILFEFQPPNQSPPYPDHSPHPNSKSPRRQPRMPYSPPLPAGYYSQPMSRHESRRSHTSAAETEPLHPHHPGASFSTPPQVTPFASPRDHNGQPFRKSPKTGDYTMSDHDFAGAGGWAYPIPSPGGTMQHGGTAELTSSRPSSSGPGFVIAGGGGGLGIVHFNGGSVRFGEHEPVNVEEARRRAIEYEDHLQRERILKGRVESVERGRRRELWREGGGGGGNERGRRAVPYPGFNWIPTLTDPSRDISMGED